jgi:hypothetical protein
MAMGAEAAASLDLVFIDHAQGAKAYVLDIEIVGEGKRVLRPQPAMIGSAAFIASANL